MMKKLHVIVAAYDSGIPLRILIDSFIVQSYPHWRMTIIHDGPATNNVKKIMYMYDDERILFLDTKEQVGNYGFLNRKMMLQKTKGDDGDFVLLTNHDNYYVPAFVEYMLEKAIPGIGMVYCDIVHSHQCWDLMPTILKVNHIDLGAFITDLGLAQEVGFNHDVFEADGLFAEECAAMCKQKGLKTIHVPKPLYVHN